MTAAMARAETIPSKRVLVVEDEVLIRMDIVQELSLAGLEVLEAANAEEALGLVEAGHRVDVVFSDIQLGGTVDGIALARRLHELRPGLPVILTSAVALDGPPLDPGTGWRRFLLKPYRPAMVLALIDEAVPAP